MSRPLSHYRAHLARLDFGDSGIRVAHSTPMEVSRATPLPGFREAVVVEALIQAVPVEGGTVMVAADVGEPIAAIAADSTAGELIALTGNGDLRAFRIIRTPSP